MGRGHVAHRHARRAVLDVLSLGAEVEVVGPADLRAAVAEAARRIAERHATEPVSR